MKSKGGSDVELLAVVNNRVFPGEWQRPALRGVAVGHSTVVVQSTYGAHPRLAKTLIEDAWNTLLVRIHSRL